MAKILGIGGIFLKAANPEKLYQWYETHLGLRGEPQTGVSFHWRSEDAAGQKHRTVWCLFPRDTRYFGPGEQTVMINYIVDDLDGMREQLRATGATVDERIEDYPFGRFGWATDAEGNRMELWQPSA